MKLVLRVFSIALFFFCHDAVSQEEEKKRDTITIIVTTKVEPVVNPIWENITIRKAFETNSDEDDKAAVISITSPKDMDDIFKVNAGIGYTFEDLGKKANHKLTTFFVYNKNNQLDKEQENYKFGLTYASLYVIKDNLSLLNDTSVEYLNDNAKKTQSLLGLTYFHMLSNREGNLKLDAYGTPDSRFAYQLNPKIGLEYQIDVDKAEPLETGYVVRSYFNAGGSLLYRKKTFQKETTNTVLVDKKGERLEMLPEQTKTVELERMFWKKSIELAVNYEGRNMLLDNYDDNSKYLYFFKTELKIYPIPNDNFSIGVSYNKGENPISGLEKQEFWMISLNFLK